MGSRHSAVLREALRFDWEKVRLLSAVRCTIGVAIPLLVFAAMGQEIAGVLASLAALYTGMCSYSGAYGSRIRIMLNATACMTVVTMLATLVCRSNEATVASVFVVAFVLGLYSSSSQAASMVSVNGVCVLIILSGLPLTPTDALQNGALVAGGGILQTVLLGVVWPVNPRFPERKAVAAVYTALADFVERIPYRDLQIPPAEPFQDAWNLLQEVRHVSWKEEHEGHVHALRIAETLRATMVGLYSSYQELSALDDSTKAAFEFLQDVKACLNDIANSIRQGGLDFKVCVEVPERKEKPTDQWRDFRRWANILHRSLDDLSRLVDDGGPLFEITDSPEAGIFQRAFGFLTNLPESGPVRKLAMQHAIRHACAVGAATALYRYAGISHGYWLPLTVAIVLRSDYASTVIRGAGRLIGTLAGVCVASSIMIVFHPGPRELIVLILAAAWAGYAVFQVNYAVYALALTLYVVFSLVASGLPERTIGAYRIVATTEGAVFAIVAYLLWPMWQSQQVRAVLRDAALAQQRYGEQVLNLLQGGSIPETDRQRSIARSLRVRAENLVHAAKMEPFWGRKQGMDNAHHAIVRIDTNAAVLLSYHAMAMGHIKGVFPSEDREISGLEESIQRARDLVESL